MEVSLLIILSLIALVLLVGRWKPLRLARRAWNVRRTWGALRPWERVVLVGLLATAPFVPGPFDELLAGVIVGRRLRRVFAERARRRLGSSVGPGRRGMIPPHL